MFFGVKVKTNAKETKILSYDSVKNEYLVSVAAPAQDGKANLELEKFFSKFLKSKVQIKTGRTSKLKIFEVID